MAIMGMKNHKLGPRIMLTNLGMALRALTQNRLQALLTLCGMSVGVAMVVIVSGLGRGAQLKIENQIESAGPTMISVKSGNYRPAGIVTTGEQDTSGGEMVEGMVGGDDFSNPDIMDADSGIQSARARIMAPKKTQYRTPAGPLTRTEIELISAIPNVRALTATMAGNLTLDAVASDVPVRIARIQGFDASWPDIRGWKLLAGRMVTEREHAQATPVVVLNQQVAERLWPGQSALGKTLPMAGSALSVVGVVNDNVAETGTIIVPTVYVPLALAQQLLKRDTFDEILVRTMSVATTTIVAKAIQESMRHQRGLPEDTLDDFRVETQSISALPSLGIDPRQMRAVHSNAVEFELASWEEMAKSLRQAGRTFTLLLAAAAAVSLLVGGIGVMNIMLVSVAARTREIGLRMAMGARVQDVMMQFMVEAVVLAAMGGMIGLLLGAIGLLLAEHGLHWATAISPAMLLLAVAMAALTGVIFGYGPARRAAALDPVVALKSE